MRKSTLLIFLGMLLSMARVLCAEVARDGGYQPRFDKKGWEILFDGKNLDAWAIDPGAGIWVITERGELYPAKAGPTLFTRKRYCDFLLELDFKLAAGQKSNSGVFLRVHNPGDEVNTGMEIQILDNTDYGVRWDAMNANGALYDLVHPVLDANVPLGEWNHYRITVKDHLVIVDLNGKKIVRANLNQWTAAHQNPDGSHNKFPYAIGSLPREGFLGLQNYGATPVWFRKVRIRPLSRRKPQYTGKEPITEVLRQPAAK